MDAKGVRNMWSILVAFNKYNTARVASCWFFIDEYYRLVVHGNSNIKFIKNMFKSMLQYVPVQTMKAYEGSRDIDPLILNVEMSDPAALPQDNFLSTY